jgi:hypothetical protein
MKPYYEDDFVQLWHGDCREVTAWLEADVLVTDPPYGRGWKQGEYRKGGRRDSDAHGGIANDSNTGARDAVLALWGDRLAVAFGDLMLPPPTGTKQVMVYRKANDAGGRGATGGRRRDAEAIYLIGPWKSGLGGASSVLSSGASLQAGSHGLTGRYGHPHAKPVDVMSELISMASGVVADPFTGGGSTLVAAKLLGRKAIGVELEERYCEAAARRLAQGALPFDIEDGAA